MAASAHLHQYLDSLEHLPAELKGSFAAMHELDAQVEGQCAREGGGKKKEEEKEREKLSFFFHFATHFLLSWSVCSQCVLASSSPLFFFPRLLSHTTTGWIPRCHGKERSKSCHGYAHL